MGRWRLLRLELLPEPPDNKEELPSGGGTFRNTWPSRLLGGGGGATPFSKHISSHVVPGGWGAGVVGPLAHIFSLCTIIILREFHDPTLTSARLECGSVSRLIFPTLPQRRRSTRAPAQRLHPAHEIDVGNTWLLITMRTELDTRTNWNRTSLRNKKETSSPKARTKILVYMMSVTVLHRPARTQ